MGTSTDKLRELAEAATPGDWGGQGGVVWVPAHRGQECCGCWYDDGRGNPECCGQPQDIWEQEQIAQARDCDAPYIAAANPAAILALLDDLDEATSIIRAFCRSGGSASFGKVTTGVWSLDKLAEAEKRAMAFLSKGEGE